MSTATAARQRTREHSGSTGRDDHGTSGAHGAVRTGRSGSGPSSLDRRQTHSSPVRRRGSRQQVSVRGRRVSVPTAKERSVVRTWVVLLLIFVAGVAFAMYLSGKTTEQSFQLSEAQEQSTSLSNELESLHRDVEDASSTQRIAAEASRLGMVAPAQAGVLNVDGDEVNELRAADSGSTLPITDINGEVTAQRPTSDPDATDQVPGLAPQALEDRNDGNTGNNGNDDGAPADQNNGAASTGELPY
ncbi:MAG: hypothetical protein ACTH2Y_00660 [Corynebacterium sp.]|uniref:hypothetical protein n=1 Tax=unclassified Corynebacterium TaxID=2624378 RepID=UPI0026499051|nr:hypothetical protein [Corynebacterium sp.]MDN5581581.1 hypothetical protein [Corynebacterium sp.]MDN5718899.1 hypothetical protein [Corynebacterium sp.]MDN6324573.1 hypothetical protein [Corynebacterium sp.]MDN6509860.1 hypothetical protein [Corynebacterium sp.]